MSDLEALFRDAGDPMVLLESSRRVRSANRAFRSLVKRGKDGVDFMDLVVPAAREDVLRRLVRAAGGAEVLIDVPHEGPDGVERVVEYRFFPLEGGMVAAVGRVRDPDRTLGAELGRTKAELRQKDRLLDEIQMELTQVPFIDPVTGVWNRLQVIERLTGEWSRSERHGAPTACLMIDVEGLADVRATAGTAVADEALKAVVRRLKAVARDHDIVGRYGGDRFVVVAVSADLAGGQHLARRMIAAVHDEPVFAGGRVVSASLRIGIATSRSEGVEIMEDLLAVAQSALADARARSEDVASVEDA
jgi:diguanylate cyclase (GGDEF)-like protein